MDHARIKENEFKQCTDEKKELVSGILHIFAYKRNGRDLLSGISYDFTVGMHFCFVLVKLYFKISLFIYISLVNNQNIISTKSLKQMMFQFNPVLVLWVDQNLFCVIFYLVFFHWNQFLLDRRCLNSRYQIDIWIHVICCWCNYGVFRKICGFSQRTRSMMFFSPFLAEIIAWFQDVIRLRHRGYSLKELNNNN